MVNVSDLKFRIGIKFLAWGSKLVFTNKSNKEKFKDAINRNILIGSHCDSGGHLHGHVKPMCEYDTQSVINVLNRKLITCNDVAFVGICTTEKKTYYDEAWKY